MKRLTSLWSMLATESASRCGTSATQDIKTVLRRVECEGESFLTISLPRFGKAFDRSLELGLIADNLFDGFHFRGGLPEFLQGFLRRVFDTSGTLLMNPCIDSISSIRLLSYTFEKIKRECTQVRTARAMRKFIETEEELGNMDTSKLEREGLLDLFQKASTLLWADVFAEVENILLGTHQLGVEWVSDFSGTTRTHQNERNHIESPLDTILGLPKGSVFKSSHKEPSHFHVSRPVDYVDQACVQDSALYDRDDIRPVADELTLVPRHGPGATADRLSGNGKFDLRQWPLRLERVFPYGDYALPSWRYNYQLDRVQFLEPGAEVPVKVTPVPKTLKTPRIIAIEPTAVQYMQQSLSMQLVNCLEKGPELPPSGGGKDSALGRFFVGFKDQEPNRFLAYEGSINGALATLDLSDASDRVLNEHVLLLFSRFPHLSEGIQATRSRKARVPGHGVIPLAKFASMGSALCFPVEAMVFTTIIFAAIAYERRVPLDRKLILSFRNKVRVYGDDIIVPVEYVLRVIQFLEAFGLKVNKDKSFWNGKFRESCGGDYYDGEWVTPIRLRHDLPRSLADVDEVVGLVAFRNLLYWGGYWKTARMLDDWIPTVLKGRWPVVAKTAAGLGRESALSYQTGWLDPNDHSPRVSGAIVRAVTPDSKVSGEGALLKFLLKRGILPSQDRDHLERQGRPVESRIKLRGIRPY